jgi:DNA topoisomerase-1
LGLTLVETLEKFCPSIVSIQLTSELEGKMERIELGQLEEDAVIAAAMEELGPTLEAIKGREREIGEGLSRGVIAALASRRVVGDCPICHTGKLMVIYSRKTGKRFIGCSNYSRGSCRYSAPLPQRPYAVKPTRARCKTCGWPMMVVSKRGSRPWRLCVNTSCPTKERSHGGKGSPSP